MFTAAFPTKRCTKPQLLNSQNYQIRNPTLLRKTAQTATEYVNTSNPISIPPRPTKTHLPTYLCNPSPSPLIKKNHKQNASFFTPTYIYTSTFPQHSYNTEPSPTNIPIYPPPPTPPLPNPSNRQMKKPTHSHNSPNLSRSRKNPPSTIHHPPLQNLPTILTGGSCSM